jgi:3-hydroxyisobutyrate dehydrogenase-like beta-hydroxyacid dehydrogenase
MIEVIGETVTLAEKSSIQKETVVEMFSLLFPNPIILGYLQRFTTDSFEIKNNAGFTLKGGIKDIGFAQRLAKETDSHLPISEILVDHAQSQLENGMAESDWGILAKTVRDRSFSK